MVKKKKGPNFKIWLEAPKKFGPACMQPNCGKVSNGNVLFDTFCTKLTTFKTHAKLASGQARWLHAEIRCLILKPIRAQKESHASVTLDNL